MVHSKICICPADVVRQSGRFFVCLVVVFPLLVSRILIASETTGIATTNSRPNILVILTDDLGFGDVSCNGATAIKTPSIDSLAETGVRFTSGYCTASTCTPTRFSLLTGTYAFRVPGQELLLRTVLHLLPLNAQPFLVFFSKQTIALQLWGNGI